MRTTQKCINAIDGGDGKMEGITDDINTYLTFVEKKLKKNVSLEVDVEKKLALVEKY